MKDKHDKAIAGEEEQKNRWREHFEEILNRLSPANTPDILPVEPDLPVECGTPTKQKIKKAIRQMKSGKAPGRDNIPAEALKVDVEETTELLHPLFVKMWEEEIIPASWKEGYLVKIPKKGDLSNCANYRGITLLSIPGKVFNRCILNRLRDVVDPHLGDQQAGIWKERSCTDQIATLRIILEQSLEWNSSLMLNFIDYEKAFESVDRRCLWSLLRLYGVPEKVTNIIRNSYEGATCRVVHGQQLTDSFTVRTGVKHGCLLSPFMFLLAID